MLYPCARFNYSFPNSVVQTSLVAGYFANFLYFLMYFPITGCIIGAQKCSNGVVVVCVGILIAFVASLVINFGIGLVRGFCYDGVGLCIVFLLLVISRFGRLGGGVE